MFDWCGRHPLFVLSTYVVQPSQHLKILKEISSLQAEVRHCCSGHTAVNDVQTMLIPRRLLLWSNADVLEWLDHNNLQDLRKQVTKLKINGRKLLTLTPADVDSISSEPYLLRRFKSCLQAQWDQARAHTLISNSL